MSKIEDAKGLVAEAMDTTRPVSKRAEALAKANLLRAELKVGWGKITPDGQAINYASLVDDLKAEAALEGEPAAEPKPAPKATKPAAPKPSKAGDEDRGKISALVRKLLTEGDDPYEDIVAEVRRQHPSAKTSARSVASTAAELRKRGTKVSSRRPAAKAKEE